MENISFNSIQPSFRMRYPIPEPLKLPSAPLTTISSSKATMRRMRLESQILQMQICPEETLAEKTEIVTQTITKLSDAIQNHVIQTPEDRRLLKIARKLKARLQEFIPLLSTYPVPGCCRYAGEDYLTTVVAIAEKQERVENAIKLIQTTPKYQDEKVCGYFRKVAAKLKEGINVPLPDYFHATRAGLENIIRTETIKQSANGAAGPGTYVSCNNEGNFGYGHHAFAIDESCFIDTQGACFTGRMPNGEVFYSLWVAVLKDIPILEKTIAFIDTDLDDIPYVRALLEEQNLQIDVLDRKTGRLIHEIFDASTKRRELPSFSWRKLRANDYLPTNMYLRSELGNFRDFKPQGLSLE